MKLMNGTTCAMCYAVLYEKNGYQLGIKPIMGLSDQSGEDGELMITIGFRIRVALTKQKYKNNVGNENWNAEEEMVAAFPNFDWKNKNNSRLSMIAIVDTPLKGAGNGGALRKFIEQSGFVESALAVIDARADGATKVYNEEEIKEYVLDSFDNMTGIVDEDVEMEIPAKLVFHDGYDNPVFQTAS